MLSILQMLVLSIILQTNMKIMHKIIAHMLKDGDMCLQIKRK